MSALIRNVIVIGFFTYYVAVDNKSCVAFVTFISDTKPVSSCCNFSFTTVNKTAMDNQWSASLTSYERPH